MNKFIILITLIFSIFTGICYITFFIFSDPKTPLNISIKEEPIQTKTTKEPFFKDGFKITPLYDYNIKAVVLAKKKYSTGTESVLSNYDLALGWREMAVPENFSKIKISQRNRWYYWRTDEFFIPRKAIEHNSSNHHILHANDLIKEKIKDIEKYDVVEMKGYLVRVDLENNNWNWKSSTTRKDTGNHSCEVFYITNINIIDK